jgi:hypothetical protein
VAAIWRSRTAMGELVGLWYSYSRPVLWFLQMWMYFAGEAKCSWFFDEEEDEEDEVSWGVSS